MQVRNGRSRDLPDVSLVAVAAPVPLDAVRPAERVTVPKVLVTRPNRFSVALNHSLGLLVLV